jgi:hypothetical protein
MIGVGTPKLAAGIVAGTLLWASSRKVSTVDTGTAGAGVGFLPLLVPPPALYVGFLAEASAEDFLGVFTPLFLQGLSVGLSSFLATALIRTSHPGVGVGVGVATVGGPPSRAAYLAGLSSQGVTGPSAQKLASVLGNTMDKILPAIPYPVPIVGPPSPTATVGTGVGSLLLCPLI